MKKFWLLAAVIPGVMFLIWGQGPAFAAFIILVGISSLYWANPKIRKQPVEYRTWSVDKEKGLRLDYYGTMIEITKIQFVMDKEGYSRIAFNDEYIVGLGKPTETWTT